MDFTNLREELFGENLQDYSNLGVQSHKYGHILFMLKPLVHS